MRTIGHISNGRMPFDLLIIIEHGGRCPFDLVEANQQYGTVLAGLRGSNGGMGREQRCVGVLSVGDPKRTDLAQHCSGNLNNFDRTAQ